MAKETINPFRDEKKEPTAEYPKNWEPISISEQLEALQGFYPNLDSSHVASIAQNISLPEAADAVFVVPKPSIIAAKQNIEDPFGKDYRRLLEVTVLNHIVKQRNFLYYRGLDVTDDTHRIGQLASDAIRRMEEEQPGDYMVFAAQTGKKWAGTSPSYARWEMEHGVGEFPLPSWCAAHIILTNPARLENYDDLGIDCPGDEYRFKGSPEIPNCFCFYSESFGGGELWFSTTVAQGGRYRFGSASGFLP